MDNKNKDTVQTKEQIEKIQKENGQLKKEIEGISMSLNKKEREMGEVKGESEKLKN